MIRKIRVSRELIDEFFRDGYRRAFSVSNGVPEAFSLLNIELEKDAAIFWFAPKDETHAVDDSHPIITTYPDPEVG